MEFYAVHQTSISFEFLLLQILFKDEPKITKTESKRVQISQKCSKVIKNGKNQIKKSSL